MNPGYSPLELALTFSGLRKINDHVDLIGFYDNYYGVTKEKMPDKYEAILGNVYDFLYCLCGAEKGADIGSRRRPNGISYCLIKRKALLTGSLRQKCFLFSSAAQEKRPRTRMDGPQPGEAKGSSTVTCPAPFPVSASRRPP